LDDSDQYGSYFLIAETNNMPGFLPVERGVVTPAFCAFDCSFIILIVYYLFFLVESIHLG
jgi:hypothetical protein